MAIQSAEPDYVGQVMELFPGADRQALDMLHRAMMKDRTARDDAIRAEERERCGYIAFSAGCLNPDCRIHEACRIAAAIHIQTPSTTAREVKAAVKLARSPEGMVKFNKVMDQIIGGTRAPPVPAPEHGGAERAKETGGYDERAYKEANGWRMRPDGSYFKPGS